MDHIGIDVHKRESQIYILAQDGEIIERRIRTEPARFAAVFEDRLRARILIEASTDSEWVARCLEALGHEVIVADPNFAPMYATRSRKIKTDRRDARALAEACLLGAYRPAGGTRQRPPLIHARGVQAGRGKNLIPTWQGGPVLSRFRGGLRPPFEGLQRQRHHAGHLHLAVLVPVHLGDAHPEGLRQFRLTQAEPGSGLLDLSRSHGLSLPLDSR